MFVWAADLHFNSARTSPFQFGSSLAQRFPNAKGLILTGDISVSHRVASDLKDLHFGFGKPIYFVLGNHDYWDSSFRSADNLVREIHNDILYLQSDFPVDLGNSVQMVGVSGWYDAGYGEPGEVLMEDFYRIADLKKDPVAASRKRAEFMAAKLVSKIEFALSTGCEKLVIVTHIPPFEALAKEADHLAWYGSKVLGDCILKHAPSFKEVLVLCGHTHFAQKYVIGNILAYSGEAKRVLPVLAGTFDEATFSVSPI